MLGGRNTPAAGAASANMRLSATEWVILVMVVMVCCCLQLNAVYEWGGGETPVAEQLNRYGYQLQSESFLLQLKAVCEWGGGETPAAEQLIQIWQSATEWVIVVTVYCCVWVRRHKDACSWNSCAEKSSDCQLNCWAKPSTLSIRPVAWISKFFLWFCYF